MATVERHRLTQALAKHEIREIFKGTNFWRLFIAFWPKAMQQLVGQSLTNNYGTYFCKQMYYLKVFACVRSLIQISFLERSPTGR